MVVKLTKEKIMIEINYGLRTNPYIKTRYRDKDFYYIRHLCNMDLEPNRKYGGLRTLAKSFKKKYRDLDKERLISEKAQKVVNLTVREYWKVVWEEMLFNHQTVKINPKLTMRITDKRSRGYKEHRRRINGVLYTIIVNPRKDLKEELDNLVYAFILTPGVEDLKRLAKKGYMW